MPPPMPNPMPNPGPKPDTLGPVFGWNKKTQAAPESVSGKGHATPKRRDREAEQKRPLAPAGSRQSSPQSRAQRDQARDRMNRALQTGEERYLPARDKGPVRRWTRDYTDSHTTLREFFLFAAIAMILAVVVFGRMQQAFAVYAMLAMYAITIGFAVDAAVGAFLLRRALNRKFAREDIPRGTIWYGISRSIQIRRARLPKPQVARGQYPE
jgi:hypothetical protein